MDSIFDIIGPVMIGPSSSHTAGAARLGKMARYILNDEPINVQMTLYGSFAKTYKGHGTNKALTAGLLGFDADDARIPEALELAKAEGMVIGFQESEIDMGHPNVVSFDLAGKNGKHVTVLGRSLGGGRILVTNISGLEVEITGENHAIMTLHQDRPGVVAMVTEILAKKKINISGMRVFRREKYVRAVMIIETDTMVDKATLQYIRGSDVIEDILAFKPL